MKVIDEPIDITDENARTLKLRRVRLNLTMSGLNIRILLKNMCCQMFHFTLMQDRQSE